LLRYARNDDGNCASAVKIIILKLSFYVFAVRLGVGEGRRAKKELPRCNICC
jgi:hypothetical protein